MKGDQKPDALSTLCMFHWCGAAVTDDLLETSGQSSISLSQIFWVLVSMLLHGHFADTKLRERDIFLKLIMNGNHYICKSLLLHSITEQRLWKSWKVKEGETNSWTFLICPTDFRVFIIPKTHLPNLSYLYAFCTESPPLFLLEGGGGDICPGPCRNQT